MTHHGYHLPVPRLCHANQSVGPKGQKPGTFQLDQNLSSLAPLSSEAAKPEIRCTKLRHSKFGQICAQLFGCFQCFISTVYTQKAPKKQQLNNQSTERNIRPKCLTESPVDRPVGRSCWHCRRSSSNGRSEVSPKTILPRKMPNP